MNEETTTGKVTRMLLSAVTILVGILITVSVILQRGNADISMEWYVLYVFLGLWSFVVGCVAFISDFALKRLRPDSLLAQAFFIFERTRLRPLSLWAGTGFVLAVLLSIVVAVFVGSTGHSIFPVANPFSVTMELNAASIEGKSTAMLLFDGAVVPAWLEEPAIFFSAQATTAILLFGLWLLLRKRSTVVTSPILFWMVNLASIALWAGIFSLAHVRYGGNQAAVAWAFMFEFTVQLINQLTGSFVSWLPHLVHNGMVIETKSFSLVLV